MARKDGEAFDYLDDAFDDEKAEAAMLEAQKASNRGCLLALLVGVVGIIAIFVISFGFLATLIS